LVTLPHLGFSACEQSQDRGPFSMADIREDVLLDFIQAGASRQKFIPSVGLQVKSALRTLVVATAGSPLRHVYRAIYRAHLAYALRQLRKLPGLHSIYLTRGMA